MSPGPGGGEQPRGRVALPQRARPMGVRPAATSLGRDVLEVDGRSYLRVKRLRRVVQRATDLFFAGLGLVVSLPVFVVVALLIKLDSRGPVFYKQIRIGLHRRPFQMWKFRKMRHDLPSAGPMVTVRYDRRMTRVGRILERTKLDELPQLFNVLRGEMSVVGPRPDVPKFIDHYPEKWDLVLSVKPGIFGASQNHFRNESELYPLGEADIETFYVSNVLPEMLDLDVEYAMRAGLRRDMRLLFGGVAASVFGAITSKTVLTRRFYALSFTVLSVVGIAGMVMAQVASNLPLTTSAARHAILLAVIAKPLSLLLVGLPKSVAGSMTAADLRRLLWGTLASTGTIVLGVFALGDLEEVRPALLLDSAFFVTVLIVYKLSAYSAYLTFFVQASRVVARRVFWATVVLAPLSVVVVTVAPGAARLGGGPLLAMLGPALVVRPLVMLLLPPPGRHPALSSWARRELPYCIGGTLAGSSAILLGAALFNQVPAPEVVVADALLFGLAVSGFSLWQSLRVGSEAIGREGNLVPACTRLLVVGAGVELAGYLAALDSSPEHDFEVVGLVTTHAPDRVSTVGDRQVLGEVAELRSILERVQVDEIIALPSLQGEEQRCLVELAAAENGCGFFPVELLPPSLSDRASATRESREEAAVSLFESLANEPPASGSFSRGRRPRAMTGEAGVR